MPLFMHINLTTRKIFVILILAEIVTTIISIFTGSEFYFCLKPFIHIGLTIFIYLFTTPKYNIKRQKKFVNQITIMATIAYILIYFLSGILFSFANNPLNMKSYNIIFNILYYIPTAISVELIRYRLTNTFNYQKRLKNIVFLSIILTFYMSNIPVSNFMALNSFIETFYQIIIPNFVIGCFLSYVALNGSLYSCIIYTLCPTLFNLFSPIVPNPEWIITVIIKTIIPLLCYTLLDRTITQEKKKSQKKSKTLPYYLGIGIMTILVLFSCGIFRYYPVAIASNSMNPTFSRGDIQIIDKEKKEYQKGDIIQFYGINNTIFVHRVISTRKEGSKIYYTTKGDNNDTVDLMEISEDKVIGKAILTIKYLGYPTVWISEIL